MSSDRPPVAATSHGLQVPVFAATAAGSANTAPPITWLTPIAVRSHRPSARLSAGRASERRLRESGPAPGGCIMAAPLFEPAARSLAREHTMPDPDITIKPRDVMPAGAITLPAAYYTDPAYFRTEMDRLFARDWICAGRSEQVASPGQYFVREVLGESIIITRARIRRGAGVLQRLPPSRDTPLCRDDGALRRRHPVPVSRLDLRARRPPGRCAAHGRRAALRQGGLPAASRRGGRVGRPHLHLAGARLRRRSWNSSPISPPNSPAGACRTSASAIASSTTCGPTGS